MNNTILHALHIISNSTKLEQYIDQDESRQQQLQSSDVPRRRGAGNESNGNSGIFRGDSEVTNSWDTTNGNEEEAEVRRGDISDEEIEAARGTNRHQSGGSGQRGESQFLSCSIAKKGKYRLCNTDRSPWKVVSKHSGTTNLHYHIIYISTNPKWRYHTRFGQTIGESLHKVKKITCLPCLLEYLSPGPNRETLRDILTKSDKRALQCAAHSLGIKVKVRQENNDNQTTDSEGGNSILTEQSTTFAEVHTRMVQNNSETDEDVPEYGRSERMEHQQVQLHANVQSRELNTYGSIARTRYAKHCEGNNQLVLQLCKNRAFDEAEAQRILCQTPEGIAMQFTKKFGERIKTAVSISRILVFQETAEQRIQRCKELQIKENPLAANDDFIAKQMRELIIILNMNGHNVKRFATITKRHFFGQTNKKNNLFFVGSPSTGKTMIMESLVQMHYNYERLTGLTPGSSFNFCSLVHSNACFMDECKLTENQFEQWKLLAAGQPMATDIKYKNRSAITNCRLYTASNYNIEMYVQVPDAKEAITTRTYAFQFNYRVHEYLPLTAFTWEEFWNKHALCDTEEMKYHGCFTEEDY